MNQINLRSYAKINIGLNIISRRTDNYHNIETILQQIDLHDLITMTKTNSPEITVRCSNPGVPNDAKNICYQAVKDIQQATGIREGVTIDIEKRIPIAAGLGGGSSNAASVIQGLQQLWRVHFDEKTIKNVAMKLGADVLFFIDGGAAFASGTGEILAPIKLRAQFFCVLIYPNIEISTTWAYKNFNFSLTRIKKSVKLAHFFFNENNLNRMKNFICNDLEGVVFQHYPMLAKIKDFFYAEGAFYAAMSGSGSTIYGLFQDLEGAVGVMKSFRKPFQIVLAEPIFSR
ncbi:MAG TPA: 4-(cytidine 5'-diphospho)-2-C-methyl-D-erythritol kinase [bacterium]